MATGNSLNRLRRIRKKIERWLSRPQAVSKPAKAGAEAVKTGEHRRQLAQPPSSDSQKNRTMAAFFHCRSFQPTVFGYPRLFRRITLRRACRQFKARREFKATGRSKTGPFGPGLVKGRILFQPGHIFVALRSYLDCRAISLNPKSGSMKATSLI